MKSEIDNTVTHVKYLLESMTQIESRLEEIRCSTLDEDQRSAIWHIAELVGDASSAASCLMDTLDAWD